MGGVIKDCLNIEGTIIPEDNDKLISFVITGTNRVRRSFRRWTSLHDLVGDFMIIFLISISAAWSNTLFYVTIINICTVCFNIRWYCSLFKLFSFLSPQFHLKCFAQYYVILQVDKTAWNVLFFIVGRWVMVSPPEQISETHGGISFILHTLIS